MYDSHDKDDQNRLSKYISISSPKYKSASHPIIAALQRLGNLQQVRFEEIEKACFFLESCLTNTEQTLTKLEERIHQIQQMRSTQTISNLRQKQSEFIILELKEKLKKYEKNQQNMQIELRHLKKQLETIKRQQKLTHNQMSHNASRVKVQISEMEKIIAEKDAHIQELNKKINQLIDSKKEDKKAHQSTAQKLKKNKDEEFRMLEAKLLELEKDFDLKVASLQQNVKEKSVMVKKLEEDLERKQKQMDLKEKQFQIQLKSLQESKSLPSSVSEPDEIPSNMTLTFNPAKKQMPEQASTQQSAYLYELELKLTHQQNLYKELEHEHTTHLTQCNNLEIQLHQQIHQQKIQLQEQKKKFKTQKKKTLQLLQSLPSLLNKRGVSYFETNTEIETVIEELKKLILKEKQRWEKEIHENKITQQQHEDKISDLEKQNRKIKSESNLVKQEMQNISQQLQRLVAQREKQKEKLKQKDKEKLQKQAKSIKKESDSGKGEIGIRENSSFITESNKSNSNSRVKVKQSLNGSFGDVSNTGKSDTMSLLQEKYKTLLENLKVQIQQKQQNISELQNLQTIDFEKSKQKILAIEFQLADSRNQVKKLQRQAKELKEKLVETAKQSESLKNNIQELKDKQVREKQALMNNQEQKVKTLQEKITKLKDQNQQIDSKCQQKVMKYNKLKGKVQKLQMYNNETEKRKDAQIQDLIKKNQHLKMECKLLEEKLNLAQTLQINTTTDGQQETAKTPYGYNKDLIEQIQMERDRILEQYETKRRENIKLKEQFDKISDEKAELKLEINKFEQFKEKTQKERESSAEDKQKQTQETQKTIAKFIEEKQSLNSEISQLKKDLENQTISKQIAEKDLAKLNDENSNKSKQEYQHLKKQLQTQLQTKKKLQKEQQALVERIKQLKEQNQKVKKQNAQLKKELVQKAKSLQIRWQQKYKEKTSIHHQEIVKLKQEHKLKVIDLEQKISEAQIREENLVNIINYKNMSVSGNIRESMKGDEDEHKAALEEVRKYDLHELLPISQVKQIELGQVENAQTSTQDVRGKLKIDEVESVKIEGFKVLKNFTLERLKGINIESQKVQKVETQVQSVQVNIFDKESELLAHIKQYCPSVIESIVRKVKGPAKEVTQFGVNTDQHAHRKVESVQDQIVQIPIRQSIKSSRPKQASFILDKEWLGSDDPSHSSVENMQIPNSNTIIPPPKVSSRQKFDFESNKVGRINLFQNLKPNANLQICLDQENIDDNFQICEEGESINVGRTALNLQIKEIFNKLREQLEKVFNGEEISLSMIKILPRQLEDDYNQFIGYVREKISQIKSQNQLSFIMAEVGDSPDPIDDELDNQLKTFMEKKSSQDIFTYKKLVQEKQALITSLMNERTMQENTINQMTMEKEQLDEEHQNRFMNQCNIYKKEIKELKNKVDNLEMNFQSLKNIFKNTMEIWVDEMENQDDLRDNFTIYKKIAKLTQTESTRLNYYIFRYKEIKGIDD